jgi:hypothetical protein
MVAARTGAGVQCVNIDAARHDLIKRQKRQGVAPSGKPEPQRVRQCAVRLPDQRGFGGEVALDKGPGRRIEIPHYQQRTFYRFDGSDQLGCFRAMGNGQSRWVVSTENVCPPASVNVPIMRVTRVCGAVLPAQAPVVWASNGSFE